MASRTSGGTSEPGRTPQDAPQSGSAAPPGGVPQPRGAERRPLRPTRGAAPRAAERGQSARSHESRTQAPRSQPTRTQPSRTQPEAFEPIPEKLDEQTVFGVNACLALWERRPHDILRVYHAPVLRKQVAPLLAWAASQRLPYRELDEDALRKVAGATHHEGLVLTARPLLYSRFDPLVAVVKQTGLSISKVPWLALDGVDNPHNQGAILRSAAFFNVPGVLVGGPEAESKVNAAVLRVAEGGAEHVPLHGVADLAGVLDALAGQGSLIVGIETDGDTPLRQVPRLVKSGELQSVTHYDPAQNALPLVLVLGNERSGLSARVRATCSVVCPLEGAGRLNSLNVSVSAAVALARLQAWADGK